MVTTLPYTLGNKLLIPELGDGLATVTFTNNKVVGITKISRKCRKKHETSALRITIDPEEIFYIRTFSYPIEKLIQRSTNLAWVTHPFTFPSFETKDDTVIIDLYGIPTIFHVIQSVQEIATPNGFIKKNDGNLFTFIKALSA